MPTTTLGERLMSPEQIKRAESNYLQCLNLPPSSQVLIVTDKFTPGSDDILIRKYVTTLLETDIKNLGHRVGTVNFNDSLNFEEFGNQTLRALNELEELAVEGVVDKTTTIIYLGEKWKHRTGMYKAAEDFGAQHDRVIRWAGSLGFSMGDAKVMSELTLEKMQEIYKEDKRFSEFFKEKPQGSFEITTRGTDGTERVLNISYDTKEAPFEPDTGQFDEEHNNMLTEHVKYINIPGGETFAAPYPFQKTNGEFAAEGMLLTVKDGLVESIVELEKGAKDHKDPMQKDLIELVEQGKKIPVAELGLGYYALLGIKTYSNSSILSREKSGPHLGLAHPYSTSEKALFEAILKDQEVDFHHTDFVLDNPVLIWTDPKGENRQQFYPPPEN